MWVVAEAGVDGNTVSSTDLPAIELKVQDGKYAFDMGILTRRDSSPLIFRKLRRR